MATVLTSRLPRNPNSALVAMVTMADGSTYRIKRLLAAGKTNTKLSKNGKRYLTLGLSNAPHKQSGIGNLCPHASSGCKALCLNISGRTVGQSESTNMIIRARIARARLDFQDRPLFLRMLRHELSLSRARSASERRSK
jgi:hypothetical protein